MALSLPMEQKWLHRREEDYKAVRVSSELKLIADRCYHVRTAPGSDLEKRANERRGRGRKVVSEERKG